MTEVLKSSYGVMELWRYEVTERKKLVRIYFSFLLGYSLFNFVKLILRKIFYE